MKNEIIMFNDAGDGNKVKGAMVVNDYSKIKTPEWNRNYTPSGLKDLRDSMSKHGNLTGIIVVKYKGAWLVVDGNHRVKVAQENNLPCVALIVSLKDAELTENDLMVLLNVTPKNWKPKDYLNNGVVYHQNKDYIFLRDVHQETGIGIAALYMMYSFDMSIAKAKKQFELGEWQVTTKSLGNRVIKYSEQLIDQSTKGCMPFAQSVNFLRGFAECVSKKGYSQEQMLKQAKKFPNHIHDNDKPNQHRAMLNNLYNHCVLEEEELYLMGKTRRESIKA